MEEQASGEDSAEIPVEQTGDRHAGNDPSPFAPCGGEQHGEHHNGDDAIRGIGEQAALLDQRLILDMDVDKRDRRHEGHGDECAARPVACVRGRFGGGQEDEDRGEVDVDVLELAGWEPEALCLKHVKTRHRERDEPD